MSDRRTFLRGLVSLPLIGGGVTLIGRPSVRVPLQDVAVAPLVDDPRQRALYAWEAFSAAMRDVTAGSDGWSVMGGEQVREVGYMPVKRPWLSVQAVSLVPMPETTRGLYDHHTEVGLACS